MVVSVSQLPGRMKQEVILSLEAQSHPQQPIWEENLDTTWLLTEEVTVRSRVT